MHSETRGVVVPFRATRQTVARRRAIAARAVQTAPVLPCLDPELEAQRNAAWDELLRLTIQAWSWRDPDSVRVLEGALDDVKVETARDWRS
ncbi:MAG TPA: hypothetical protein VGR62_04100 [Candidatus Binatia bacterium]|jgi:hypothetical protein|nr:hypothetical protein [Candidatus Binatia bacterium]